MLFNKNIDVIKMLGSGCRGITGIEAIYLKGGFNIKKLLFKEKNVKNYKLNSQKGIG